MRKPQVTHAATTPREELTPRQRSEMHKRHGGICVICGLAVDPAKRWIDEHVRPLGLLGSNRKNNRGPAHILCAGIKTKQDMKKINKAKAQGAAVVSKDPDAKSKLQSRGFEKKDTKHKIQKQSLPPRALYK